MVLRVSMQPAHAAARAEAVALLCVVRILSTGTLSGCLMRGEQAQDMTTKSCAWTQRPGCSASECTLRVCVLGPHRVLRRRAGVVRLVRSDCDLRVSRTVEGALIVVGAAQEDVLVVHDHHLRGHTPECQHREPQSMMQGAQARMQHAHRGQWQEMGLYTRSLLSMV